MKDPGFRLIRNIAWVLAIGICSAAIASGRQIESQAGNAASARPAVSVAAEMPDSRPCHDAGEDRESERCAAWAAAHAGADAARWAFWQMLLSALGFAGLLISLHYTRNATRAAAAANADAAESLLTAKRDADAAVELARISQENAERELRAYVDCQSMQLTALPAKNTKDKLAFRLSMKFNNFGRTPASEAIADFEVFHVPDVGGERTSICKDSVTIGTIPPNDHCQFNCFISLEKDLGNKVKAGGRILELSVCAIYKDVFAKARETKCEFEGENQANFGAIEGTRFAT